MCWFADWVTLLSARCKYKMTCHHLKSWVHKNFRVHTNYQRILQKPYFHKYWTEIHDVTTIWKRDVCSFKLTSNAFDVRPKCDTADVPAILPFPPFGGNGSIAVSHVGCTSNAFKVTMKLQTFLFQMVVTSCISVQYLWKYGFVKSSDNVYAPRILENTRVYVKTDNLYRVSTTYLSVSASFTWAGSLEARVLGYINGESVSTNSLSKGISPSSSILRTPLSDLSLQRYPAWPRSQTCATDLYKILLKFHNKSTR